jgi:hypothetical protein
MIEDLTTTTAACPTCRAPLAADQRYCLYCGTRAPGARIESLEALRAEAAAPPPPPAVVARAAANPAVPVLAVVAALGVGALLGHWATQTPQPAASTTPATQVIRVTGAAAAPAATAAASAPSATATPAASHHAAKTAATPTPTAVKDLSKDSIKQAVKHKAPISTGGAPPPKDNKPAGGGSSFTTIG